MDIIKELKPSSSVTCEGLPLPFPPDLDDFPLRKHIGDYSSVSVQKGIEHTLKTTIANKTNVCKFNIGTELRKTFGDTLRAVSYTHLTLPTKA